MMILFFFSSRRRHTRSKRDWSSDVCSSDLERGGGDLCRGCVHATGPVDGAANVLIVYPHIDDPVTQEGIPTPIDSAGRSEERRVGKECRSRWTREQCRKKQKANQ